MPTKRLVLGYFVGVALLFAGSASIGHGDRQGFWYGLAALVCFGLTATVYRRSASWRSSKV
jgi:drug/metabolite transporter (DMT)-like permease